MIIVQETASNTFLELNQGMPFRDADGIFHGWEVTTMWSDEELADINIYKVTPAIQLKGRSVTGYVFTRTNGVVNQILSYGDLKTDLKAYVADVRWAVEVTPVAWNEHLISTDRETSQQKLGMEFLAIIAGLRTDPSPWKFNGGEYQDLTNAQMQEVCVAARNHIAAAFDKESAVIDAIDAGTITTAEEIDAEFSV